MTATLPRTRRPSRPPSQLFITITDRLYAIRQVACDPHLGERAFRLLKDDGALYDVIQTRFGPTCDCPDFIFRRDGLDPSGCKHIRALTTCGLISGLASRRSS